MKRLLPAAAAVLLLALAGCGGVSVDKDSKNVTVKDKDGNTITVGQDLPKDFPKSDVPLVKGEVAASQSGTLTGGTKGWSVQIKVDKAVAAAAAEADTAMKGKGYTVVGDPTVQGDQFSATQYSGAKYQVNVTVTATGDKTSLATYIVSIAS